MAEHPVVLAGADERELAQAHEVLETRHGISAVDTARQWLAAFSHEYEHAVGACRLLDGEIREVQSPQLLLDAGRHPLRERHAVKRLARLGDQFPIEREV